MTPADLYLTDLAVMMGVTVEYTHDLPADRDGDYNHPRRHIRIREGLHARHTRSVLAHELGHASFGHVRSRFGPVNAKQERAAEEWAALRLISIDDYRAAEESHRGHLGAIAIELGVMRSTVAAFHGLLTRLGDATYLAPRMGERQWDHRELALR
ncbi:MULTISPECIES: ImmA/IrrE family metallo-endopeptidase [unclassified Microbacterium]|uniref:ImmA/IrrE family metallo-endopeptidase n=1 Tax=unclassified Microbacterium TaxID=2609290 RepID=UPI0030187CFE